MEKVLHASRPRESFLPNADAHDLQRHGVPTGEESFLRGGACWVNAEDASDLPLGSGCVGQHTRRGYQTKINRVLRQHTLAPLMRQDEHGG